MNKEQLLPLIPRHLYSDGCAESIELPNGMSARIKLERDADRGAPWDEEDGHGPVSAWRDTESKRPGERVLCTDRRSARFYDVAEAIKIARRDGWDAPPYGGLKGERAARAVEADFQRMRAWCADQWCYIGVVVTLHDADGAEVAHDALWGIESDGDYWRTVAAECLENCIAQHAEAMRHAALIRCFC